MSKTISKTHRKKIATAKKVYKSATKSTYIRVCAPLGPCTGTVDASVKARVLPMVSSERDYNRALAIAEDLITRHRRTRAEEAYLDCIATLIEAYENKHHPINVGDKDPIEILRHLLEANGMNASDLGRLLGNRSLGSKILNGDRGLSKPHIMTLAKHFSVRPGLFLSS